ncbi:MAG: HAMP domain-containing histidine kinase [Bacteroidales bacterium]|jgi:hypothetical protein|nr:HAMP domain-containing histidine kinase [Bacteroidales bacterium]
MYIIILIDIVILSCIAWLLLKTIKFRREGVQAAREFSDVRDEYQTLNSSLPVGFFSLSENGDVEEGNSEFVNILKCIDNIDYKDFNLFKASTVIPQSDINHLKESGLLDTQYHTSNSTYSDLLFRIRRLGTDASKKQGYIGTIIDKTEDISTSSTRAAMYSMFQLAMDKANIAVATVNAFDSTFNVTNAWYNLLYVNKGVSLKESFKNVPPEDLVKITNFMNRIKNIQFNEEEYAKYYGYNISSAADDKNKIDVTANIKVLSGGKTHYIRFYGILTEYSPDEGKMIIEFVLFNIDGPVEREIKLLESLHKTRSAETLKNKSIANMSTEIQQPLNNILEDTSKIFSASKQEDEKRYLKDLSRSNAELLLTISEVINISRIESDAYIPKIVDIDPGVLAAEVVNEFKAMLKENVFIEYHPASYDKVSLDIRLVKELLRDLAISSAKRTSDGTITFTIREEDDGANAGSTNLFMAISDTGTPLNKEEMHPENYKSVAKLLAKTNLEIYIAHHLANMLGGKLGFEIDKKFGKDVNTVWCRILTKKTVNN